ncbi:MAG: signal peptidase II [Pseudomonadales bacterium]|jgi:signal peptidase II|nr:signal peptidase II [Pseudomonadales bacterium]
MNDHSVKAVSVKTVSAKAASASAPRWQSLPLFLLAAALVVIDQVSKLLANTQLNYGEPTPVLPSFDLLLMYNRGAAFSFLNDAGGWQRWILSGISLGVSLFLGLWLMRLPAQQKLLRWAVAVILGGALGNLYDRVAYGYVVDFISLYWRDWRFATFNIADAAISVGAALLVLDVLLSRERNVEPGAK